MRLIALVLSILLAIAPWSGVLAMPEAGGGQAGQDTMTQDSAMPCHDRADAEQPACEHCGQLDCDLGDCPQCTPLSGGILHEFALHLPRIEASRWLSKNVPSRSTVLPPDSPPPIA